MSEMFLKKGEGPLGCRRLHFLDKGEIVIHFSLGVKSQKILLCSGFKGELGDSIVAIPL